MKIFLNYLAFIYLNQPYRLGPRFLPLSDSYDKDLRKMGWEVGKELGLMDCLQEGCYVMQAGPCFETIAECRMLKILGADVAG